MRYPTPTAFPNTVAVPPAPAFASSYYCNFKHSVGQPSQDYIHTAVFDRSTQHVRKDDIKGQRSVAFDLDLKDLVRNTPSILAAAKQRIIDTTTPENDLRKLDTAGLAQHFIYSMSEKEVIAFLRPYAERAVASLTSFFAQKPTKIVFSGNGAHFHYWVDDLEGWASSAQQELASVPNIKFNADVYQQLGLRVCLAVNKQMTEFNGQFFDEKFSKNLGGKCRDVGDTNTKNANNPKVVQEVFADLCDASTRLKDAEVLLRAVPQPQGAQAAAASSAGAASSGTQQAKKGFSVDLSADYLVAREDAAGVISVVPVSTLFEEMLNGKMGKVQCRMLGTNDPATQDLPLQPGRALDKSALNCFAELDRGLVKPRVVIRAINIPSSKAYTQNPLVWYDDAAGGRSAKWTFDGARMMLQRDQKGRPMMNVGNLTQIFIHDSAFRGHVFMDVRLMKIVVSSRFAMAFGEPDVSKHRYNIVPLTDVMITAIRAHMAQHYFGTTPSKEDVTDALKASVEYPHARRDFVLENVQSFVWDGVDRFGDAGGESWLNKLLHNTAGSPAYDLYREYGIVIMNSLVRSIVCGNTVNSDTQHCVIFTGDQGTGKSTLSQILGLCDVPSKKYNPHLYVKMDGISMNASASKESAMALVGKFYIDASESLSLERATTEDIKKFVTEHTVQYRPLYSNEQHTIQKNAFLVSSTNHQMFLSDTTGERRFLVINLWEDLHHFSAAVNKPALDLDYLRAVVEQLYAQAYQRVVEGNNIPAGASTRVDDRGVRVQNWNLNPHYNQMQAKHNQMFQLQSELTMLANLAINRVIEAGDTKVKFEVFVSHINQLALARGITIKSAQINNRLSNILSSSGWRIKREAKGNFWVYDGAAGKPSSSTEKPTAEKPSSSSSSEKPTAAKPTASAEKPTAAKPTDDGSFDTSNLF